MVNKEILGILFKDSFSYSTCIGNQFQPDWPFWPILYSDTLIISWNRHCLHLIVVRERKPPLPREGCPHSSMYEGVGSGGGEVKRLWFLDASV